MGMIPESFKDFLPAVGELSLVFALGCLFMVGVLEPRKGIKRWLLGISFLLGVIGGYIVMIYLPSQPFVPLTQNMPR